MVLTTAHKTCTENTSRAEHTVVKEDAKLLAGPQPKDMPHSAWKERTHVGKANPR
jgi:hypothetical protein